MCHVETRGNVTAVNFPALFPGGRSPRRHALLTAITRGVAREDNNKIINYTNQIQISGRASRDRHVRITNAGAMTAA